MTARNPRSVLPGLAALVVAVALAGCGSTAASVAVQTAPPTATPMATSVESASTPSDASRWLSAELTDVTTGEVFTIAGLPDLVLVQGMARSNPTSKSQADQIKKLRRAWEGEGLTVVSLDIETDADAVRLKSYAAAAGYDWPFAVAPADVMGEMSDLYGSEFMDPSSAPMWLVTLGKEILPLPAGVKSAEDLQKTIVGSTGV